MIILELWLDIYYNGVTYSTYSYSSGDLQVTFPSTSDSLWSCSPFLRARVLTTPLLIKSLCFNSGSWAVLFLLLQKHKYPHLECTITLLCIMFVHIGHTHYHQHPFYFVLLKFKDLVAKQHPTASTCSWLMTRMSTEQHSQMRHIDRQTDRQTNWLVDGLP